MAERELDVSPVKIKLTGGESGRADYPGAKVRERAGHSVTQDLFRSIAHYELPMIRANSHHYAGNMLWRTVAVLPLADRQLQSYASSVTTAASIDRADVRPLLSAHKTAS